LKSFAARPLKERKLQVKKCSERRRAGTRKSLKQADIPSPSVFAFSIDISQKNRPKKLLICFVQNGWEFKAFQFDSSNKKG